MTVRENKSDLTPSQQRLVAEMQRINFGRIEELAVRRGEPVLDPKPRIVREIKFGGANGTRPEAAKDDFPLTAKVRDLFTQLEALGDGVVLSLEIQHGLPFRLIVEEVAA